MKPFVCGAIVLALSASAEAQPCVVTGHDDPATDAAQVQSAVDTCDDVVLRGTFDFTGMESGSPAAVVRISREVTMAGTGGPMPTIRGGETPFLVDAPGAAVAITGLRFVFSRLRSVLVGSVNSISITGCEVEGTLPVLMGQQNNLVGVGFAVGYVFPGAQVNHVTVADNRIDLGGAGFTDAATLGVSMLVNPSMGGFVSDVRISRNVVTNVTSHGIDLRNTGGSAEVDDNVVNVTTGAQDGNAPKQFVDGIRCLGPTTMCNVHQNRVESRHPNSAGIRLQRTIGSLVERNDIDLKLLPNVEPGPQSTGVQVIALLPDETVGPTNDNVVAYNTITGRARTALEVVVGSEVEKFGTLVNNGFLANEHSRVRPAYAHVKIGAGALETRIVREEGTICDFGDDTIFTASAANCPF